MILRENPGVQAILNALPLSLSAHADGDHVVADSESGRWVLQSLWIGEGFPNDFVRAAEPNWPFSNHSHAYADAIVPVITARRISPGARKEIEARGLSWADLAGRAHISAPPGLLISRLPARTVKTPSSAIKWSESAGAVAETILHLSGRDAVEAVEGRPLDAERVSQLSGFSYPQVNKVLQQFEGANYIAKIGTERGSSARRFLRNPSALLSDWAGWHTDRRLKTVEMQTLWRSSDQSLNWLQSAVMGEWAVTGWLGADLLAPFSTAVPTVACYVEQRVFERAVEKLLNDENIDQASTNGRISVAPAEKHVLNLADLRSQPPVVSPIRVYGDLLRIGGRGEEAAQHLREVAIGF